jgi:plastocyanin
MEEPIRKVETMSGRRNYSKAIVATWFAIALLFVIAHALRTRFTTAIQPASSVHPAVVITMTDIPPRYVPQRVTVLSGSAVEWRNTTKTLHDVTTEAEEAVEASDISLPPGERAFDSGFMSPGATFSYTFTVSGTYRYMCIPHEKDGMVGEIVVKE